MKVGKVAEIVEREVIFTARGRTATDVAALLTNLSGVPDPNEAFQWSFEFIIGKGSSARSVQIPLQTVISNRDFLAAPSFLGDGRLIFFRGRLFLSERAPKTAAEREELVLRVKKAVYDEDNELVALRSAVANCEAAVAFTRSGTRREAIPDDVKMLVWARDGGSCVRCGSRENLHFDHVIPVAKGGGNSEANIQILCQACNLRKSDEIVSL